jgi:hypothetical protein
VISYPVTWAHGPITFNEHLDADGSLDRASLDDSIVLLDMQENPAYRDLRDPYHLTQGGQLGRVHKGMRVIQLIGRITVPDGTPAAQRARMYERTSELRAAFDPSICYRDSPTTDGAHQLAFSEATTDTSTYPSGRIPLQYWARPVQQPWLTERLNEEGNKENMRLVLLAADPRSYEQTEQSLTLTPASPSGSVTNRGNAAAPVKVTYTMSGAGSSACTLTRALVSFVLNLSGRSNGDSIVVIHETCGPYGRGRYITLNTIENAALKTSAASTWLDVPVGTTTWTLSNTTGISSVVLRWYSARA